MGRPIDGGPLVTWRLRSWASVGWLGRDFPREWFRFGVTYKEKLVELREATASSLTQWESASDTIMYFSCESSFSSDAPSCLVKESR